MMSAIETFSNSPLFPLVSATLACYVLTQLYKRATKAAHVRHTAPVERTLPLVPAGIGAVLFALFPHELGVGLLVNNGHHAMHALGSVYGAVLGFTSSGLYRALVDAFPSLRTVLNHAESSD